MDGSIKSHDCIPPNFTKVGNKIRKISTGKTKERQQNDDQPKSIREKQLDQ